MNYSALVVSAVPGRFEGMLEDISKVSDVEIHQKDAGSGRCIVVIEGRDVEDEMEKFKELSALDSVIDVSLVVHRFDEETQG